METVEAIKYQDLAGKIDHLLLRPNLSDDQIEAGCRLAVRYGAAAVVVRPSDVSLAANWLRGTGVALASVAGYPHGASTTATKLYEARDLLQKGAKEIDAVLNIGKMISRQFQYVEMELLQLSKSCHESGAVLKVIFDNASLPGDLKVIACRIAKRCETDYFSAAAEWDTLEVYLRDVVKRKATQVDDLAGALAAHQAGCARIGTENTAAILDAWRAELENRESSHPAEFST